MLNFILRAQFDYLQEGLCGDCIRDIGIVRTYIIDRDLEWERCHAGTLWIHSVPKEVADALSDTEKKRQEAINEVIYTERDFVRDMEYLKEVCASGLCWLRLTT